MFGRLKKWINDLLTGKDNQTIAIARVMGMVVFVGMMLVLGLITWSIYHAVLSSGKPDAWGMYLDKAPVFVLLILSGIAALIGGTAFSEPAAPITQNVTTAVVTRVEKELSGEHSH